MKTMHCAFYFTVSDESPLPERKNVRPLPTAIRKSFFIQKEHEQNLCVLKIFPDASGGLSYSSGEQLLCEATETTEQDLLGIMEEEGYKEISEEEFLKAVDANFPRWRELKFNRKTKEMFFPALNHFSM